MLLRRLLHSTFLRSSATIAQSPKPAASGGSGRRMAGLSLAAGALLLSGCSGAPQMSGRQPVPGPQYAQAADSPAAEDPGDFSTHDPLEKVNRAIFSFDMTLDKYALRPVAKAYRDTVPGVVRTALTNVLHNIQSPIILANDLLQGNMPRFGQTFARIWMNTILGLGGFNDVAAKAGIPFHEADFGQTLGVWGVGPGPYLVLPVLGPSDPRDALGFGVDSVASPFGYAMRQAGVGTEASISTTGSGVINDRSHTIDELDELQRNSLDFYATIRSLYQQKRVGDVHAGKTWVVTPAPKAVQSSRLPESALPPQLIHVPASAMPPQSAGLDLSLPLDMTGATPSVLNTKSSRDGAS